MSTRPDIQDGLDYSRELVELMQHEAEHATWWWFRYAAVLIVVVAAAASAVWPWGWAS